MSVIIYRSVGNYSHFLNCVNGQIVSFEVNSTEAKNIMSNMTNYEFDREAKKVFKKINGQFNSRLCRRNLIKLGLEFKFPTMVNIELNRRCSLRCIHCYVGNKNLNSSELGFLEQMNESDISGFFDELKDLGVFLIAVTGGEPFISNSLQNLLRMGTEKGFLIEIFSNLQNLPDWFLLSKYESFRVGRIQTSVYSSTPNIHDGVTKIAGSLKRTLKNIHSLIKRGYLIEVATPMMRKNFSSWESTRLFFEKKKIAQNFSWPIADEYYGLEKKSRLNISGQELDSFIRRNPNFLSEKDCFEPDEYICEAGKAIFALSAAGDVFPCSQMPLSVGNTKLGRRIKEIVFGEDMFKIGSLKWEDVSAKKVFNFCLGINYTDSGNLLTQPKHMLNALATFMKQKRKEVNEK